jgi:hypothetical protein
MGFIFQRQLGVSGIQQERCHVCTYVAARLAMALKKSIFRVGLFLIFSRSLDLERIGCAEVLMGIGKY